MVFTKMFRYRIKLRHSPVKGIPFTALTKGEGFLLTKERRERAEGSSSSSSSS